MKKYSAFSVIIASLVCVSQVAQAQGKKEGSKGQTANEANRFAREGAEAAKNQDLDKAVDLLRKATNMDHKYADELSGVYQRRGYAYAKSQQFQEAIQDYSEAIKIQPKDPRIYEQRAAVEMKMYDYDKALADYSELIKLKPNEVRYLNYRAYVYEVKDDIKDSMADNEQVLKVDPNNQEAKTRKQRLEQKQAERMPLTPPPAASPVSSPKGSPPSKKKPSPG
jgi:tetratricopeptide (TPR) repeat protein